MLNVSIKCLQNSIVGEVVGVEIVGTLEGVRVGVWVVGECDGVLEGA